MQRIFKNPRWIIVFFVFFMVSYIIINGRPYGVKALLEISNGNNIIDFKMAYTPDQAYQMLEKLGAAGREFYLNTILRLDFLFPSMYAMFYFTALVYILGKLFPNRKKLSSLAYIGILAGIMDWLENICIIQLLTHYPNRIDPVAWLASVFSTIKMPLNIINMILVCIGFITVGIKRMMKARKI